MKTRFLTRLNILIAGAALTLTVGVANALPPDKIPHNTRDTIPVELALVFMFLAFVAGYGFRMVISKVHRALHARRLRHSIRQFQR